MSIKVCDCSQQGVFALFCIQQACQLPRRLCSACKKRHSGHSIISYDHPQSFDVYSINSNNANSQQIRDKLKKTIEIAKTAKTKFLLDLAIITQQVKLLFDNKICGPLIARKDTNREKLQLIADQLRVLNAPCFSTTKWLISMNQHLAQQLAGAIKIVEKHFQEVRIEFEEIQFLSPFSSQLDITKKKYRKADGNVAEKFEQIKALRNKQIEDEKEIRQAEQRTAERSRTLSSIRKKQKEQEKQIQQKEQRSDQRLQRLKALKSKEEEENREILKAEEKAAQRLKKISNLIAEEEEENAKIKNAQKRASQRITNLNVIEEKEQEIRKNFLKSFNKNVIGWLSNQCVSVQDWKKSKRLKQIQQLYLCKLNLEVIPQQLNFFSNLKRLDLSQNKIQYIQNLENLTKLQQLFLNDNNITEIKSLKKLTNLKVL